MVHQNTRNRRNGAQFETDLVKYFRAEGFDAERLRLSGAQDEGDLVVRAGDVRYVVEAKAGKNLSVRRWFDEEAVPEAKSYAAKRSLLEEEARPALLLKSHGKNINKSLVTIDVGTFVQLLHKAYTNEH